MTNDITLTMGQLAALMALLLAPFLAMSWACAMLFKRALLMEEAAVCLRERLELEEGEEYGGHRDRVGGKQPDGN